MVLELSKYDYEKEIVEIIDYLNLASGRKFKTDNNLTSRLITSLLRSNYTVENFKTVIDNKVGEWEHSSMEKYIRPSTLFHRMHFDEYLNQSKECQVENTEFINKESDDTLSKSIVKQDGDVELVNKLNKELMQIYRSMPYDKYLLTDHWIKFKQKVLKNALNRCQLCGSEKFELHVHHNNYENRGRETFNDVVVLCEKCHAKFHDKLEDIQDSEKNRYKEMLFEASVHAFYDFQEQSAKGGRKDMTKLDYFIYRLRERIKR
jgi:uncharacterized phage protein (TIGR02220 family)